MIYLEIICDLSAIYLQLIWDFFGDSFANHLPPSFKFLPFIHDLSEINLQLQKMVKLAKKVLINQLQNMVKLKSAQLQKLAISKKSTVFIRSTKNLVKIVLGLPNVQNGNLYSIP